MSTRLSAEELDAIEVEYRDDVRPVARSLMREVRESWADRERALRALAAQAADAESARAESVRLREELGEVTNAVRGVPFDHPVRVALTKYAVESLKDSARTFDDEHDGSVLRVGVVGERTMEQECDSLEAEALKDGEFVGITNGFALRLVSECRESVRLREALRAGVLEIESALESLAYAAPEAHG